MNLDEQIHELKQRLAQCESIISPEIGPGPEDLDGIIGHGMELSSIIGTCAKCLADAKTYLGKKELLVLNRERELWNKPTILKKMMDSELAEENGLVVLADRLMSACTHKMDFYRSIVSKYKEELRLNTQFNQQ